MWLSLKGPIYNTVELCRFTNFRYHLVAVVITDQSPSQWFLTGVLRHTRVPREGARGVAKY